MGKGGINKREIDKLTKDLDRELQRSAKRNIKPIQVPTGTARSRTGRIHPAVPPAQPSQVVHGPLIQGNNYGPMAWDNTGPVHQHSGAAATGVTADDLARLGELAHQLLAELAQTRTIEASPRIEEDPTSGPDGAAAANAALATTRADASALWAETQQVEPDPSRITTLLDRLKTTLPGLASGIVSSSLVEAFTNIPW